MRVILSDFGRRKFKIIPDRDFKGQRTLSHGGPCVYPSLLKWILAASSTCSVNFPLAQVWAACCFWLSEKNFLKLCLLCTLWKWQSDVPLSSMLQLKSGINKSYNLIAVIGLFLIFNSCRLFCICLISCGKCMKVAHLCFRHFHMAENGFHETELFQQELYTKQPHRANSSSYHILTVLLTKCLILE